MSGVRDEVAVLVPAYEPDGQLAALAAALRGDFARLVVVDDGSSPARRAAFDAVRAAGGEVLVHAANRGKGAALKTGFAWILRNLPEVRAVVTADADGQHRPDDIRRVAEAALACPQGLVLGVRAFAGEVPLRSRFGNAWARGFFRLLTGVAVQDTQTGLRGVPRARLEELCALPGARYEYEAWMLVAACRWREKLRQVPIATVYREGNKSSHYRPFRDSVRTQCALWRAWLGGAGRGGDEGKEREDAGVS